MSKPRPGWTPPNPFPKGIGGNPRGRPKGSKDRTPRNVWELLRSRGDRDPLDILSQFANSEVTAPELRLQASAHLAGYFHGKRSALRWVQGITNQPEPTNVTEATAYVARIVHLMAEGRIDVDAGIAIRDTLLAYINARTATDIEERLRHTEALVEELMLRNVGTIREVVGGLPVMPGCEQVSMPHLGPPTIDRSANPWAGPPQPPKPEAGPEQPEGPKRDPEPP
jgi:hypothetical protein